MNRLARYLPILHWGRSYDRHALVNDGVAAVIVTIMLIPQSLAYAMLAGLPPVIGLYASILPLVVYALFGSSRTLSVGPVAVVSLLTATAASSVATPGSSEYIAAALTLAFLSGLILVAMGIFRLGFVANLLSHPVISGFITASSLLIATGQLKYILGVKASGDTLIEMLRALAGQLGAIHWPTVVIGVLATAFLFWARKSLRPTLVRLGVPAGAAALLARTGPVLVVVASITAVVSLGLDKAGVAVVGAVPQGLPPLSLPDFAPAQWLVLLPAAFLIALIGFVESVSVAQTLAAKRRQSISPDQELIGLGMANLAAAFSSGYPVTGGFARSVVNFDAGAQTPAAGALTAIGIAMASLFLTPLLYFLPIAVLAATIIVAVLSLADFGALARTWKYSRADFSALAVTLVATLAIGVETGIIAGVIVSILLHLWSISRPHVAVIGQVPGTQHFRNVLRHQVICVPEVLGLRIDESLFFANARAIETIIQNEVATRPQLRHVVLNCAAVNSIDASALESLELVMHRLSDAGIALHLSEVKGPVMDRLQRSDFLHHLTGRVFLSHYQAVETLAPHGLAAA
ncbi:MULTISPECIES: SulP family inorganic anion transporter [unclassified Paracoccus (in: a-proteobacteria)]|uniref:SulP family inorganic anion transporter n=1 Tax=unclassified Paracoccus (in: a-proteobacteria) TaxID=2688777 RepID=UPI0012B2D397|nr:MULTISPECIES: sulfate permease [unclassified Paracoccus (in: a-proteobacteria)]UXU74318.1 sulfate permease [Paracoccus sp. SMMA_5]UXU80208.1 sulfate permease [Paracoccus sp. SMMA_5_TC]